MDVQRRFAEFERKFFLGESLLEDVQFENFGHDVRFKFAIGPMNLVPRGKIPEKGKLALVFKDYVCLLVSRHPDMVRDFADNPGPANDGVKTVIGVEMRESDEFPVDERSESEFSLHRRGDRHQASYVLVETMDWLYDVLFTDFSVEDVRLSPY